MFTDITLEILLLLAAAAFLAGIVDAISGGGGLIVVPSLLLAGLPPVQALGTNKLQGLFGLAASTAVYAANGRIDLRRMLPMAGIVLVASGTGAVTATVLPGDWLQAVLPPMLVAIALYFLLRPNLDDTTRAERVPSALLALGVIPAIAFYDGLFGPGAGSFYMLAFVALAGYGMLGAVAHTRLLNCASNLGAFLAFAYAGAVVWHVGLVMGAAAMLGARVGARFAMKRGARVIKPLLVLTCTVLAIRLTYEEWDAYRALLGF